VVTCMGKHLLLHLLLLLLGPRRERVLPSRLGRPRPLVLRPGLAKEVDVHGRKVPYRERLAGGRGNLGFLSGGRAWRLEEATFRGGIRESD